VLLKDYILDKKILDMEDIEVEVVYDIKMVIKKNKLFVTDVDPPAYARSKRTGLNSIASIFHKGHDKSEGILIPFFLRYVGRSTSKVLRSCLEEARGRKTGCQLMLVTKEDSIDVEWCHRRGTFSLEVSKTPRTRKKFMRHC